MPLQYSVLSSTADITIKLRNRGPDAYKRDVYGDCISIEHRISCDGCRTCRLRSKSGDFPELQMRPCLIKPSLNVRLNNQERRRSTSIGPSSLQAVYILYSRSGMFPYKRACVYFTSMALFRCFVPSVQV